MDMVTVVGLLITLLLGVSSAQDEWREGTKANPSPSVFSLEQSHTADSYARQPDIGRKTADNLVEPSALLLSDIPASPEATLSYSDSKETLSNSNNEMKAFVKRSVEGSQIDETLEGKINTETLSVVDNNLDAPATAFSNQRSHIDGKNLADKDFYEKIQPTKSDYSQLQEMLSKTQTGEGQRASVRGRALPLPKPNTASDLAVPATNMTQNSSLRSDKPSPDIHDIINGFVKLLNGNVQVQVNPNAHTLGGRPLYPIRTRINNRGPPRITDVPLLDFEPPLPPRPTVGSRPSHPANNFKDPPPYPFDIPEPIESLPPQPSTVLRPYVSGIPLPEQIVPEMDPDKISITTESDLAMENFNKSFISPSKTKFPFGGEHHKTKLGHPINNDTELKESTKKPVSYKPINSFIQPSEVTHFTKPSISVVQHKEGHSPSIQPNSTLSSEHQSSVTLSKVHSVNMSSPHSTIIDVNISTSTSVILPGNFTSNKNDSEKSVSNKSSNKKANDSVTTSTSTSPPEVENVTKKSEAKPTGSSLATPLIESSMTDVIAPSQDVYRPQKVDSSTTLSTTPLQIDKNQYFPRPGIVLDDPEYKPGGGGSGAHGGAGGSFGYHPIITVPPKNNNAGEIFDVIVSAIQGPGSANTGQPFIYPVDIEGVQVGGGGSGEVSVITTAEAGQHFVSIDGKRTYINLFNTPSSAGITPTPSTKQHGIKQTAGTYTVGQVSSDFPPAPQGGSKRPQFNRRPTHPPVRIDTCIVGDDSTCDKAQNERCRTEVGVSSCHCRPGYSRRKHREPCIRVVSIVMSLRVDRMYDQRLTWSEALRDKESPEYLQLEYESSNAIDSAMQMTPFSDEFLGCRVNSLYTVPGGTTVSPVFVNLTLQLEESAETLRPAIKKDIQRHLLGVIHRRSNNIGSSPLWVDSPTGSVSQLQDLDECQHPDLHDCHHMATCSNSFGTFHCACPEGYRDPWAGNSHHSGRECHTCPPEHCNHRGDCRYLNDQPVCKCSGSYYGAQCEIDGEVLGVAIGASVAAVIIIVSTLVCLCMWSRRWSKEQKVAAGMGSPVFGYMATAARNNTIKAPTIGSSSFQVSLEDRLRWAQIADVMAQATNHYAPEPGGMTTRPGSVFGYGGTLPHLSAPVPMPRLSLRPASVHGNRAADSSCSEEEDRTDLLGRNFHVPRPKSRSSVANQSGIYYDVDYEQQPIPTCIPMNTYTMSNRSNYYCS